MAKHGLSWLVGGLMVLGLSGWCLAAEGDAPKTEPKKDGAAPDTIKKEEPPKKEEPAKGVDELRSISGKLAAARTAFIKSKPELLEAQKQIQDKRMAIEKEQQEFYAKLRTLSPDLDALEKKREEIEAARKKERDEHKAARPPRK